MRRGGWTLASDRRILFREPRGSTSGGRAQNAFGERARALGVTRLISAATPLKDSSPHAPSRLARPSRPPRGAASTSQGHPRTIFRRALEHDNLVLAEVTAREIGRLTIAEALELTALVARKQPHRYAGLRPTGSASGSRSTRRRRWKMLRCSSRICNLWRPRRTMRRRSRSSRRPHGRAEPEGGTSRTATRRATEGRSSL